MSQISAGVVGQTFQCCFQTHASSLSGDAQYHERNMQSRHIRTRLLDFDGLILP